jgi:lysyl-tRNA synthetase class 2
VSEPPLAGTDDLPEQMRVRRAKREQLVAEGVAPYPVSVPVTHSLAEVRADWSHLPPGAESGARVGVAGRVIFVRNTGKLCFATVQAGDGTQLQLMLSAAVVGAEALDRWKALVDLGDHVFAEGEVVASRRGELSVMADSWQMTSKALRPLPVLHKELSEEQRVRRRYVDLIVREQARQMVRDRAAVTRAIREVMHHRGYLEVETPTLQTVHGGANARPFTTHLNAFDLPMTLRIALELHLKRAVVGGIERVYEIGRIFRNEGIDSSHSPEFTMLEAYEAYGDQESMAELTRDIVLAAADALGSRQIAHPQEVIDLDAPWSWLSFYEGLSQAVGEVVTVETTATRLQELAKAHGLSLDADLGSQRMAMELFEALVEPGLIQPTFVCDYPAVAQPLARPHRSAPGLVEAWDLIVGGTERATAFSELVDPHIQRERLTEQAAAAALGDEEAMAIDEDFLQALEHGAPPMGGLGVGIDRLMMLLTGAGIRETILFPFVKPQG